MTINLATCTQDDIDDSVFTEYNEGFVSYMFGKFLHNNPYHCLTDESTKLYCMWYDGWQDAKICYPQIEPRDE